MPKKTLDFYDDNAAAYAADGKVNPKLPAFLDRCRPGGMILELGTGSGRDAKAMLDAGFRVDATDGSAELANIATRNIGQTVRVMQFGELEADATYDGIYASAALLHAPFAQLVDIITRIHKALRPDGVVWASFKAGNGEGLDSLGRYYNYPSAEQLLTAWTSQQWSTLVLQSWEGNGYDRQPTDWLGITAIH